MTLTYQVSIVFTLVYLVIHSLVMLFVLYNAYLITGIVLTFSKCPTWCDGVRLLTLLTVIVYISILISFVKPLAKKGLKGIAKFLSPITNHEYWYVMMMFPVQF